MMNRSITPVLLLVVTAACAAPARAQFGPENAAMGVLDQFMAAFNARDDEAMCRTFHYPHVRFASGAVRTYETYDACVEQFDFARFAERFCSAPGFLDSGLTVFASMLPRPARRSHVAPERGFDSGTSLASTARCTSA